MQKSVKLIGPTGVRPPDRSPHDPDELGDDLRFQKHKITNTGILRIEIAKQVYQAKLDTGADIDIISEEVYRKLPPYYQNRINRSNVITAVVANKESVKTIGTVVLPVLVNRQLFKVKFHVLPKATHSVFLGKPFHKLAKARVDHHSDTIRLTNSVAVYSGTGFEIDPYSEVMCYANLGNEIPEGTVGLCAQEHSSKDKGLMAANVAAMVRDQGVPMRLYNYTNGKLKINRGEKIGIFTIFQEDDYCIPFDLNDNKAELPESNKKMTFINSVMEQKQLYEPNLHYEESRLSKEELGKLKRLMSKHHKAFLDPNQKQIGVTNAIECKIETVPGAVPICKFPYRMAPAHKEVLDNLVEDQIKAGILEETDQGAWNSSVLLVRKPGNDGFRLVCDFRELNKLTVPMVLKIPKMEEVIDSIGTTKPKYFSVLDLSHGGQQIPLEEKSRDKSAFLTHKKKLRFKTMPPGSRNSSMYLQLLMDTVLKGIQYEYVISYTEDIVIYSKTFEDHLNHLEQVLVRLEKANLKLNPDKCRFAVPKVKFLGHTLSEQGIGLDQDKIEVIKNYPTPANVKELRGFLGVTGYYRKFVENYAEKARPLYALTKKDVQYKWDSQCEKSFQLLRQELISDKILVYPDFSKKFVLATDASDLGIGACLSQMHDGVLKPIGFAGRGFTSAERNYHTTDKELLAVVYGVQYFRVYLTGAQFDIHTDHAGLRQILTTKNLEGRQARWVTFLQKYDYKPIYIRGRDNIIPDQLSRRPYKTTHTETDDAIDKFPDILSLQNSSLQDHQDKEIRSILRHSNSETMITPKPINVTKSISKRDHYQIHSVDNGTLAHCPQVNDQQEKAPSGKYYQELHTVTSDDKISPQLFRSNVDHLEQATSEDDLQVKLEVNAMSRAQRNARRDNLSQEFQTAANEILNELDFSVGRLQAGQAKDPQVKLIFKYLKHGRLPRNSEQAKAVLRRQDDYLIIDGTLYHMYNPIQVKPNKTIIQLVIPQDLKGKILAAHHEIPMVGHMNATNMVAMMKPKYHWIGMLRDITDYAASCATCKAGRVTSDEVKLPLSMSDTVDPPFATLFINLKGPFARTARGNRYLVIVTDQYSRYVVAWPTHDISTKTIATQFYHKVISVYGAPRRIISDYGTAFTTTLSTHLFNMFEVKQSLSAQVAPLSPGSVERVNKTTIKCYQEIIRSKGVEWDLYIAPLTFALNSSDYNPIGYSAYLLQFGRNARKPTDLNPQQSTGENSTSRNNTIDLLEAQKECHVLVDRILQQEYAAHLQRYDDAQVMAPLALGDVVYVYQPNVQAVRPTRRQCRSYHGPYLVNDFRDDFKALVLKKASDGKILDKLVSVDRVKKGTMRSNPSAWNPMVIDSNDNYPELEEKDVPENSFIRLDVSSGTNVGDGNIGTNSEQRPNTNNAGGSEDDTSGDEGQESSMLGDRDSSNGNPDNSQLDPRPHTGVHVNYSDPDSQILTQPRSSSRSTKGVIRRSSDFIY